ncbi:MAG: FAD-binding oxidoreductase [Bacteroidia bacterium]|nr:FAD-binding oxidoreductase [Bacteroidia bacterium]MBP7715247.1 FAD-binding oxidoreductase [Bacteroidia bacterium]HQW18729.1 FAD-dependent oxidoreductase [Bacteroidia bacterium]HQW50118.1 FAD-dependent oxidoreductase [Bacteroidia bacterium]HQZ77782.1 FAD-dependent oxidoreductase [Bacteroidia bacterium]
MQLSFWEKSQWFDNIDVVVLGSGIVGLHAAYFIKKKNPKLNVLIIERGFLPYGASTRNAGFACIGSTSEILNDLEKESEDKVFQRVEKRYKGLLGLRELLGDKNIEYEHNFGFEIFTETDSQSFRECESKLEYLNTQLKSITRDNTYTIKNEHIANFGLSNVENLIQNKFEGQLDTGKMMFVLSEKVRQSGVNFLNGLEVKQIYNESSGVILMTSEGFKIKTGKVIICTNGFVKEFLSDLSITPGRAQVMITNEINNLKLCGSFHYQSGFYYFRNVGRRVLIGGGRNLDFQGETTTSFGVTEQIQSAIEKLLKEIILQGVEYKIEQRWSGIMGLGESKSPIIQEVKPNIYCAVRLGGMGVALGYLVGKEVADLVNLNYQ